MISAACCKKHNIFYVVLVFLISNSLKKSKYGKMNKQNHLICEALLAKSKFVTKEV